jgi:LuxR family maltose regulon positive regulatory protein
MAYTGLAQVHYEWNDLQEAVTYLEQGVELGKRWVSWDVLLPGYGTLADVAMARGDPEQAVAYLDTLTAYVQQWEEIRWALPAIASQRARLAVRCGDVETAAQWAASCALDESGPISYVQEGDALILARIWLAEGKLDAASKLVRNLLASNETAARWGRVIQVLVLQALVHEARGEEEAAVTTLKRALDLAEPEGYVRTFVDAGPALQTVLARVEALPAYVATLQAAFDPPQAEPANALTSAASQPLVEPLTDRELDVLRLIAQGLTNQEIADRLFISVNTVKTHAKHIYEKLSVRNRAQATTRALEMALL